MYSTYNRFNNNFNNSNNQQRNHGMGQKQNTSFNQNFQQAQNNHASQGAQVSQNSQTGIDFSHNPKLKNIDPMKIKIIMEIQKKSKNRSIEELLPEIMKVNQELNRRNMSFTKDETAVLLDVIEENLSPAEKSKFNMLKGFMG